VLGVVFLCDKEGEERSQRRNLDVLDDLVLTFIVVGYRLVRGSIGYIVVAVKFGVYVLACDCHLAGSDRAVVVSSN